jgi:hypothetical protein
VVSGSEEDYRIANADGGNGQTDTELEDCIRNLLNKVDPTLATSSRQPDLPRSAIVPKGGRAEVTQHRRR